MVSVLQNVWVIGIGGGIICGLIVTIVTKAILAKEEKIDYQQKVGMANNEIFSSIRPSVAENIFPPKEIIESVLKATAKKYGIDKKDLYSVSSLCDDLIKDIMENTILSLQQKSLFCDLVTSYRNEPRNKEKASPEVIFYRKNNLSAVFSITIGLIAGITGFVITLIFYLMDKSNQLLISELYLSMGALIVVSIIIPVSTMWFLNHQTERKKKKKEKIPRHANVAADKNESVIEISDRIAVDAK